MKVLGRWLVWNWWIVESLGGIGEESFHVSSNMIAPCLMTGDSSGGFVGLLFSVEVGRVQVFLCVFQCFL